MSVAFRTDVFPTPIAVIVPLSDRPPLTRMNFDAPPPSLTNTPAMSPALELGAMLDEVMARLHLAIWEAWESDLALININFGPRQDPVWSFEPGQIAAGSSWEQSVYPRDRERVKSFLSRGDAFRRGESIDYRVIVAEGELLWIRHWPLSRLPSSDGRDRARGLLMAIPEQKHLEWECLRVSEHECNRIGQELHDDLCQVLAGLSFMMRVLSQRAAKVAPALSADVQELNTHVVAATDRVRSMAHGLFPAQLNYSNLREALKEFARQIKVRFKVDITLELPARIPPHNPDQIIHVFRIAQEAVTNAVRHGRAHNIRIVITSTAREIQMEVLDDGQGFPATGVRPEGIGIHIMHYRAGVLGGRLEFKNLSPSGAVARFTYPVLQITARRNNPSRPNS